MVPLKLKSDGYDENSKEFKARTQDILFKVKSVNPGEKVNLTPEERSHYNYLIKRQREQKEAESKANDEEARKYSEPKPYDNSKLHEGISVTPNAVEDKPGFFSSNTNAPTPPPIQGIPKPPMEKAVIGVPVPPKAEMKPLAPKAEVPVTKEYTNRNVNSDDPKYTNDPNYDTGDSKSGWDTNTNDPETANQKLIREQKEALSKSSVDAEQERTRLQQEQGERDRQARTQQEEEQTIRYQQQQLEAQKQRVPQQQQMAPLRILQQQSQSPSNVVPQERKAETPSSQSPSNIVPQEQSPSNLIREVQRIKEADSTEEDLSKLSYKDKILKMQERMINKRMQSQPK